MIYIDDSIMQKGFPATAGSKILENFIAPFDATVLTRLNEKKVPVKLFEFGLGDPGELPGEPLLCNDVFGFVRKRAAEQSLCVIRPTYGTVSRFGLIPAAPSMDQVCIVCKDPSAGFSLLEAISGSDENDGAMFPDKNYSYKSVKRELKYRVPGAGEMYSGLHNQILQILAYAEISCNLSRYDGVKFGRRAARYKNLEELYLNTRNEYFGNEAKLAAVMGCMLLSRDYYTPYYEKAMKLRRLVKESLLFDSYDILELPAESPLAVLAGLPSLSFVKNGKAVQLIADVKKESLLLTAWEASRS